MGITRVPGLADPVWTWAAWVEDEHDYRKALVRIEAAPEPYRDRLLRQYRLVWYLRNKRTNS